MSLLLRSFLREPLRPRALSRAMRRLDDDFWMDDWHHQPKKVRRYEPPVVYEHPMHVMEDMNRQLNSAISRMQEFAEDLDALDSWVERRNKDERGHRHQDAVVSRTESGGLQLALDVSQYKPEDLKIKLVDDNLIVEASTESSGKDTYNKSHFKRWFKLPEDCNLEEIKSKLTNDNKLVIDLPSNKPEETKARTIQIEMEKPPSSGSTNAAPNVEAETSSK